MAAARIAIVGGGPAGLMAAERLAERGLGVVLYEGMPTVGRKFLLAGKSGLNITHAEPYERFRTRFGAANADLAAALDAFPPDALVAWANGLGVETFAGSSGRVFPKAMKASPLLRAWLRRLADAGVTFQTRHRWTGFDDAGRLRFDTSDGPLTVEADAVVLALGGASWPRLGSDGGWVPILEAQGVAVAPLRPANCGFDVDWSPIFAERNAGAPVKSVTMTVAGRPVPGEFVVTRTGIEGSLVYAHAAALRDALEAGRPARLTLDLVPNRGVDRLASDLARARGRQSFTTVLRKATGLEGVKAGLVRETLDEATRADPVRLAAALKAIPLDVVRPRPIAEAISTAGGIRFDALGPHFELKTLAGVHVAGEMLDWEAPTGGYLISACMATGRWAADGIAARLTAAG